MSNPNSQGNTDAPRFSQDFEKGIKLQLKYLPVQLQQELMYRMQYDPQFIEQAMGTQEKYDPRLAQEQIDALQRRDPQWLATHQELGDKIKAALDRGYLDPRQEAAYNRLAGIAGKVDPRYEAAYGKLAGLAGEVDPRQEAAYNQWAELASKQAQMAGQVDPTRAAEYKALGKQVTGDTLRGGTASPETLKQMTQAILSRQPGLSYGEAQNMAAAVYTGQRSEALKSQRQQAGEQFLGQQTTEQQRQQSLAQGMQGVGQFYGAPSIMQQRQQSLGQFSQVMDPTRMQQASLGNFYGLQAPEQNVIGLAGTYIQPSNSITGQLNQIPGVQAPRSFGYVNPNAGYQGAQYGLQNYQNQLASQQAGGSSNPWMGALQGASTGANYGSIGGGYGAAGGAIVGGVAGAFGYPQYSDQAGKINISRTGAVTKDGIPIVTYERNGRRYLGVLAQDVEKVKPEAVYHYGNGTLGVFYSRIGVELQELP